MEAPYILFQAGKINFLVLMEYVDVIDRAGSVSSQNIPVYDFAGICGLKKNGGRSSYALLMHTDSCRFGIVSDKVVDVVNISDGDTVTGRPRTVGKEQLSGWGGLDGKSGTAGYVLYRCAVTV